MNKQEKINRLVNWESKTLGVDTESALDFVLRYGHWGWETQSEDELDDAIRGIQADGYTL